MSWVASQSLVSGRVIAAFGEPVRLPTWDVVSGVFQPLAGTVAPWGADGRLTRPAEPRVPALWLAEAEAAVLKPGEELQIRGVDYQITRLEADGFGLVRVELMAATAAAPAVV